MPLATTVPHVPALQTGDWHAGAEHSEAVAHCLQAPLRQ